MNFIFTGWPWRFSDTPCSLRVLADEKRGGGEIFLRAIESYFQSDAQIIDGHLCAVVDGFPWAMMHVFGGAMKHAKQNILEPARYNPYSCPTPRQSVECT